MKKISNSKLLLGATAGLSVSVILYYLLSKKKKIQPNPLPYTIPTTKHLDQESAEFRRSQIKDNVNYSLFLNLNKGESFSGKVKIHFKATGDNDIFLDYEGKTIDRLAINGKSIEDPNSLWSKSTIMIPKNYLIKEANNIVEVDYSTNYRNDGCGLHSFVDTDGKQYLYSQGEPYYIHNLFPCFDQPDIKGTMSLEVEAPMDWIVISNENFQDRYLKDDKYVWKFYKTPKISSYLYAVCAGPFLEIKSDKVYKDISMKMYVRESLYKHLLSHSEEYFEICRKVLEFYEHFFHYPYPFSKYDHVFCPEFNVGAMEHPGCVTMNDQAFIFKEEYTKDRMSIAGYVMAHEMAHMWFGNLVTMKWWNDLWLNESFADFISLYAMDQCEFEGVELSDFKRIFYNRKQWGYSTDQLTSTHPIAGEVANTEAALHIFDGITYSKGASVILQLLHLVTPAKFSKALGNYFKQFEWSNTVLDDFIDKMDEEFREFGFKFTLKDWNQDFIQTAGMNQVKGEFDYEEKSFIKIIQEPVLKDFPLLRNHKMQVAFFYETGNYTLVDAVINNSVETKVNLSLKGNVKAFFLNAQDQTFIKVKLDNESFTFFSENLWKIQNILTKTMLWRTIYEMVKDGELSSKKYVQTVVNNLEFETDSTIISDALSNAALCISHWTPEEAVDDISSALFKLVHKLIAQTDKSQNQNILVLKEKLFTFAKTKEDTDVLLDWIHGSDFHGLNLTTKDEWAISSQIVASPYYSNTLKQDLISGVKAEDHTEEGIRNEIRLNSRMATGKERLQLWKEVSNPNSSDSLHIRLAKFNGINHSDDPKWHFYEDFFNEIKTVLEENSQEFVKTFVRQCFPYSNNEEVMRKMVDRCNEIIPTFQKEEVFGKTLMVEGKETLERRLKAFLCYSQENK